MGKENNADKTKNDLAWEQLFKDYDILERVNAEGQFYISADEIRRKREPRLMTKFDHARNLPKIFIQNDLSILPVERGKYVIARFEAYHKFEAAAAYKPCPPLPGHIQSLNPDNLNSEAIALNYALAAGILEDFLGEKTLTPTVCGRMSSTSFEFTIDDRSSKTPRSLKVNNAQIEIDSALEGEKCLCLIEAKNNLASTFIIRQLYYPYRAWADRVDKAVRLVFMVYSNSVFSLYEYGFKDKKHYNSIELVQKRCYSIDKASVSLADILAVFKKAKVIEQEPQVPFPQADSFARLINLCEILQYNEDSGGENMTKDRIRMEYDIIPPAEEKSKSKSRYLTSRQVDYYTNACIYLGLIEKKTAKDKEAYYELTGRGRNMLAMPRHKRELSLCEYILEHKVFRRVLESRLEKGIMPGADRMVEIMKQSSLYKVGTDVTYQRRASTVRHWVEWIASLPQTGC